MASIFDSMMEEAAAGVAEVLGERDAQHALATIKYQPPTGAAIELVGWSIGLVTIAEEENLLGTNSEQQQRFESVSIFGPTAYGEGKQLSPALNGQVLLPGDAVPWAVDGFDESGVFITLRLTRKHRMDVSRSDRQRARL